MSDQLGLELTAPAPWMITGPAGAREPANAPETAHRSRTREAIVAWIRGRGAWGATRREVELAFGLKTQTTTWRLREAEQRGEVGKTARKRDACTVYVAHA